RESDQLTTDLKLARLPSRSLLPSQLYLLSRKSLSSIETRSSPESLAATLAALPSMSLIQSAPFADYTDSVGRLCQTPLTLPHSPHPRYPWSHALFAFAGPCRECFWH